VTSADRWGQGAGVRGWFASYRGGAGSRSGDNGVAVRDGLDSPDQLGRQDVLPDEAFGAEAERSERVLIQVEGREDQDAFQGRSSDLRLEAGIADLAR
jgi:hypothetical protein